MNVIAIASQKGGAGKSTFALNLATIAGQSAGPALIIDTDPQGSLSLWHDLRPTPTPWLVPCRAGEIAEVLDAARRDAAIEWVFVDGRSQNSEDMAAIMRIATLVVVPTRTGLFDISTLSSTIETAHRFRRPFFVVLNAVPPRRGFAEAGSAVVARKRIRALGAPVWRGAIGQRSAFARTLETGMAVVETDTKGAAAEEMRALWRDVASAAAAVAKLAERRQPEPLADEPASP